MGNEVLEIEKMEFNWDLFLQILGFTVGIVYLWYEYHANAKVWAISAIMPMISMFIYFRKGLYADFAINIYYVVIAIYGFWNWKFSQRKSSQEEIKETNSNKSELRITHCPLSIAIGCIATSLLIWFLIYQILINFTDSTVPIADAFTTAFSIVGLWMMARKYIEQWLCWMIVDAVCVALYFYKGIPFYAVLYGIYTVIAYFGYRKWLRIATQ